MGADKLISSGSPWESKIGYSRAVVAGDYVHVSGTTATINGVVQHPGDAYNQTLTALGADAVKEALSRAGSLGLPDYAEGNVEGFLFPATYEFEPGVDEFETLGIAHLPARLVAPSHEPLPVLFYTHGGGFTIGSVATHDSLCRHLAHLAHCAVVSLDYRLAPEHKFPTAANDAWDALQWLAGQGAALAWPSLLRKLDRIDPSYAS